MALTVRRILDQNLLNGTRLVAGTRGIDSAVTWVNVMEILDEPDSIQKGELVVTTGYHLENEARYSDLIDRMKKRGVACLAVQTGYYIESIPAYIIEAADRSGLPVLELPRVFTFSEILHVLFDEITAETASSVQDSEFADIERQIAVFSTATAKTEPDGKFCLFLITRGTEIPGSQNTIPERTIHKLSALLKPYSQEETLEYRSGQKAVVALPLSGDMLEDIVFELTTAVTGFYEKDQISLFIGIASVANRHSLPGALHEAAAGIRILDKIQAKRGVCPYWNIPFFELFEKVHFNNPAFLLGYRPLQQLFEYDNLKETEYVRTLRIYLANECNLAKSSAKLFVHRHTLSNRLLKIHELCGLNLNDYYGRLYLSLALLIHDLFAL